MNTIIEDKKVLEVVDLIEKNGGKCYLVGGSIRNYLMGLPFSDYDIEVFNLDFESLCVILSNNYDCQVFNNYGVIKLEDLNIDISLPKIELKGEYKSYYDIKYKIDPYLDIKAAGQRRDLTINALYYDISNNALIDNFGGVDDIKNKQCKFVNSNFAQDPIRLLRTIYYVLKFDLNVAQEELEILDQMDMTLLPKNKSISLLQKIYTIKDYEKQSRKKYLLKYLEKCEKSE